MKFINSYHNVELDIPQKLLSKIGGYGKAHYPNEFGGFLIGCYSNDLKKLFITDVLLPLKYEGFRFAFERSIDGIIKIFKNFFDNEKRYYVGEWHTHPNGTVEFSQMDLNAMKQIEECDSVNIKNPILLILTINENGMQDYAFYLYCNGGLIKYEKH